MTHGYTVEIMTRTCLATLLLKVSIPATTPKPHQEGGVFCI